MWLVSVFFSRENRSSTREKNQKKYPWKKKSARENFREFVSVKLNFVPVKNWKKCARESPKTVREKNHNFVWEIYQ